MSKQRYCIPCMSYRHGNPRNKTCQCECHKPMPVTRCQYCGDEIYEQTMQAMNGEHKAWYSKRNSDQRCFKNPESRGAAHKPARISR